MDTNYWKSSPFGENSIFHPKWDEKETERRQQQIEPAKITGIEIKQGTLKEDSYIGPRYDNLYPQKNHPDTIKNSFISVPIIVTISTSGYASKVFISIGNNWEQAHSARSKIGIFQKSFTIQVSSSTRKGIFEISAKIADSLDDTPCDIKKYKVEIDDNGYLLKKEEIEEKKKDELTIEIIKQITPLCSDDNILKHLSGINQAIEKNNINTYLRKVHFLTQLIYESGYLKYTKEIGVTEQSYEGFYGRGLRQ